MGFQVPSEQARILRRIAQTILFAQKGKKATEQEQRQELANIIAAEHYRASGGREPFNSDHPSQHFAQYIVSCVGRCVVHQIRPAAAKLVCETKLHGFPKGPTRLVRNPWLVEVRRPETGERLFDDVVAMASYHLETIKRWVLLVWRLREPDVFSCARFTWNPLYEGESSDEDVFWFDGQWLPIDVVHVQPEDLRFFERAVRFITIFGVLLEAENVPFRVKEDRETGEGHRAGDPKKKDSALQWVTRHIYLDEARVREAERHEARRQSESSSPIDRNLLPVTVRGHLKRQRFGSARQEIKWIFVDSYAAHRWGTKNPVKVVADVKRSE